MEINFSFYLDAISDKNKSGIQPGERISLALKSLFEEFILFSGFFASMFNEFNWNYIGYALVSGARSFIPTIPDTFETFADIITVYQAVCSLILISLAIVIYMSNNKGIENNHNEQGDN